MLYSNLCLWDSVMILQQHKKPTGQHKAVAYFCKPTLTRRDTHPLGYLSPSFSHHHNPWALKVTHSNPCWRPFWRSCLLYWEASWGLQCQGTREVVCWTLDWLSSVGFWGHSLTWGHWEKYIGVVKQHKLREPNLHTKTMRIKSEWAGTGKMGQHTEVLAVQV